MNLSFILAAIALFCAAVDHRALSGSPMIAVVSSALVVPFAFAAFLFQRGEKLAAKQYGVIWLHVAFSISIFLVAALNDVDLANTARASGPMLLILPGFLVGYVLFISGKTIETAAQFLGGALLFQLLIRFANGVLTSGADLSNMRWQILSPAMHDAFAIGLCILIFFDRGALLGLALMVASIAITGLSLTRGLIIPFGIAAIGLISSLVVSKAKLAEAGIPIARAYKRLVVFVMGVVLAGAVAVALRPEIIADWQSRFVNNKSAAGKDVTYLTREAEVYELYLRTIDSPAHIVFGNGFGSVYRWHASYKKEVGATDDSVYFNEGVYVPGHVTWSYSLFAGGVIGTIITLLVFIRPLSTAFKEARRELSGSDGSGVRYGLYVAITVSIAGSLVLTLTGNPLGERFGGFLPGLYTGVLWALAKRQDAPYGT